MISDGKIKAPVSMADITNVLNESSYELGVLCQSARINKWALWKPVVVKNVLRPLTFAEVRQACANMCPSPVRPADLFSINATDVANMLWKYTRPTGSMNAPFRKLDFSNATNPTEYNGYDPSAECPVEVSFPDQLYTFSNATTTNRYNFSFGLTFTNPNPRTGEYSGTRVGLNDVLIASNDSRYIYKLFPAIVLMGAGSTSNMYMKTTEYSLGMLIDKGWSGNGFYIDLKDTGMNTLSSGAQIAVAACLFKSSGESSAYTSGRSDVSGSNVCIPLELGGGLARRTYTVTRIWVYTDLTFTLRATVTNTVNGNNRTLTVTTLRATVQATGKQYTGDQITIRPVAILTTVDGTTPYQWEKRQLTARPGYPQGESWAVSPTMSATTKNFVNSNTLDARTFTFDKNYRGGLSIWLEVRLNDYADSTNMCQIGFADIKENAGNTSEFGTEKNASVTIKKA